MDTDDEDLWVPFLAARPRDKRAERLRAHLREDERRGQRHPPRRAAALSRDEIVRTAIRVADAEGADAVTMRRIARELNAGTMSLYWHIVSKEELLDLMLDTMQGDQENAEPSGDWRRDMQDVARQSRRTLHEHPWMMDLIGSRPPVGPRTLRNIERILAYFDGLGLDMRLAIDISTTVGTYVMGVVLREVQERNSETYTEQMLGELSETDREKVIGEFTERVRATGRYPHLVEVMSAGYDPDAAETRDARFEFGLDCLLDGIAARIAGAVPPPATGGGAAGGRPG
ncbi:MAG TPA: TetR/AcrR family transcriptional regulator [Streptosporangiaceae bacterium]